MVNSPDSEKGSEALAGEHRSNVIFQPNEWQQQGGHHNRHGHGQLSEDPYESSSPRLLPRVDMEADRKGRPHKDGLPGRHTGAGALDVMLVEAIAMMFQMIDLNGMHGP